MIFLKNQYESAIEINKFNFKKKKIFFKKKTCKSTV